MLRGEFSIALSSIALSTHSARFFELTTFFASALTEENIGCPRADFAVYLAPNPPSNYTNRYEWRYRFLGLNLSNLSRRSIARQVAGQHIIQSSL